VNLSKLPFAKSLFLGWSRTVLVRYKAMNSWSRELPLAIRFIMSNQLKLVTSSMYKLVCYFPAENAILLAILTNFQCAIYNCEKRKKERKKETKLNHISNGVRKVLVNTFYSHAAVLSSSIKCCSELCSKR